MSFLLSLEFLNKGGWVAWVLALLSLILSYAIGYRYLFLQSQSQVSNFYSPDRNSYEQFLSFSDSLKAHKQTVKSIVIVAPLLGLLGTVIGMIETFESLADASLFSQSGGIAGGISQALITTQMGLVVAIPGLLIGRKLDYKEKQLEDQFVHFLEKKSLSGGCHEVS